MDSGHLPHRSLWDRSHIGFPPQRCCVEFDLRASVPTPPQDAVAAEAQRKAPECVLVQGTVSWGHAVGISAVYCE